MIEGILQLLIALNGSIYRKEKLYLVLDNIYFVSIHERNGNRVVLGKYELPAFRINMSAKFSF